MFKVPDWEEDIPKSNINLRKPAKHKKQSKNVTKPLSPKIAKKLPKPTSPRTAKKIPTLTSPKTVKRIPIPTQQQPKVDTAKSQAKKRKHNGQIINNKKMKTNSSPIDMSKVDTDKADEILLNAKKKKFYEPIERDDVEDLLFKEVTMKPKLQVSLSSTGKQLSKIIDKKPQKKNKNSKNKVLPEPVKGVPKKLFQVRESTTNNLTNGQHVDRKKEKLKSMLQIHSNRNSITVTGNKLRERMLERLKAAQFRYFNEKLYTSSGDEAKEMFQSDPTAFHIYHQGYQQQLKKWPVNPLDVIAKRIQKMPKTHKIADMGCGEAALSKRISQPVRSFDLVSTAPGVEVCDMAHTPLLAESMDAVVYCLALMGTQLTQYLLEANRVLKMGGHLLIAEVESRFDDVEAFTKEVTKLGFKLKNLDKKHQVFFFMEFVKIREPPVKKAKLPVLTLKPCLYKRR